MPFTKENFNLMPDKKVQIFECQIRNTDLFQCQINNSPYHITNAMEKSDEKVVAYRTTIVLTETPNASGEKVLACERERKELLQFCLSMGRSCGPAHGCLRCELES